MNLQEHLKILARQVKSQNSNLINADEVAGWPNGRLDKLIEIGVLIPIARKATSIKCPGCSEKCPVKPTIETGNDGGVYIEVVCRQEGKTIEINSDSLKQWKIVKDKLIELGYYKEPEAVPESKVTDNYVFRPNGDFWQIVFHGKSLPPIKHNKRMFYLYELLQTPKKTISALELTRIVNKTTEEMNSNTYDNAEDADGPKVKNGMKKEESLGGIDKEALKKYHSELKRLRAEYEQAKANGDDAEEDRIQGDIDFFLQELKTNQGVQGRLRMFSDEAKKAADNISTAIRRDKRDIKTHSKDLYQHLENTIRTGNICSYRPDHAIDWQF